MTADKPKKTKQPAKNNNAQHDALLAALEAGDRARLTGLIDSGADIGFRDAEGRGLMHYAAVWNDDKLVDLLVAKGATVTAYDNKGSTPRDYALAYGHDALAAGLQKRMAAEKDAAPPPPLPFKDMAALRAESVMKLTDQFNYHVRTGHLSALLALAAKDADGLMAQDVLGKGPDGDTTLLKICQQGRLGDLLDVKLWQKRPDDFQLVWQHVPADYKKGHDGEGFVARLRQARLQSFSKIRLKDLKPKQP